MAGVSLPRTGSRAHNPLAVALLGIALTGLALWLASSVPNADWSGTYQQVGTLLLHGRSPYEQPLFVNPPWAAILILPFALLPPALGRGALLVVSLAALIYTAWRLHAPRLAAIALLLSPTAIGSLLAANLDSIVILGAFIPPTWGLLVLMLKPQIGVGPAAFDLAESWRTGRVLRVVRVFLPIVLAYVISALVFPVWVDRMVHKPANVWNRSLFPYGIPIGLLFFWLSVRSRNVFWALASTPFFAPYLTFPTWLVVQVGLLHEDVERFVRRDVLQISLSAGLWLVMLVFHL
jgi:hypothetical protein